MMMMMMRRRTKLEGLELRVFGLLLGLTFIFMGAWLLFKARKLVLYCRRG
jgi:hypothetical protein